MKLRLSSVGNMACQCIVSLFSLLPSHHKDSPAPLPTGTANLAILRRPTTLLSMHHLCQSSAFPQNTWHATSKSTQSWQTLTSQVQIPADTDQYRLGAGTSFLSIKLRAVQVGRYCRDLALAPGTSGGSTSFCSTPVLPNPLQHAILDVSKIPQKKCLICQKLNADCLARLSQPRLKAVKVVQICHQQPIPACLNWRWLFGYFPATCKGYLTCCWPMPGQKVSRVTGCVLGTSRGAYDSSCSAANRTCHRRSGTHRPCLPAGCRSLP